jgi:predicted dienelactone hydrolase
MCPAPSSPIALLCLLAALLWPHAARAADPAAPGPHPIAVTLQSWTDGSRSRELPLRIVRPREGGSRDGAGQPVVLFSHGLGGSREAGQAWGDHWASHGYLVIHLQHPGSDSTIWQGAADRAAAMRGMREAMSGTQFMARIADVRFVLDELARRVAAADPEVGRADLSRIGMSGHSYGAVTTQALAGERFGPRGSQASGRLAEPRIRASAAFSPSGGRDTPLAGEGSRFADIRQPFLSLTGTLDTSIASPETAQSRQLPFERMPGPDKYLLVLEGADHGMFSGQPGLRQLRRARPGQASPEADAAAIAAIRAASLMFWNAYLRDDAAARRWLLDGGLERHLGAGDRWQVKR